MLVRSFLHVSSSAFGSLAVLSGMPQFLMVNIYSRELELRTSMANFDVKRSHVEGTSLQSPSVPFQVHTPWSARRPKLRGVRALARGHDAEPPLSPPPPCSVRICTPTARSPGFLNSVLIGRSKSTRGSLQSTLMQTDSYLSSTPPSCIESTLVREPSNPVCLRSQARYLLNLRLSIDHWRCHR